MTATYKQITSIIDQWSDNLPFIEDFQKRRRAVVDGTYLQFFMALTTLGFTENEIESATGGLYNLVERRLDSIYRSGIVILKKDVSAIGHET
jgi:hypothetical protein